MIAIRQLNKSFGRRSVLNDLNLEIGSGRVTALIGANGSGKTTTIKIILGLVRPDAGLVTIDERPLDDAGEYRQHLGYMPQIARFPEHLRVRDLLETVDTMRPRARIDEQFCDEFGIGRELDKPLGALSGGTRQKVNAIIAFRYHPRLVILDEPTSGLDPVASRILKARIRRARLDGATVLVTSHVLSELHEMADDVAFLRDGCIQFEGTLSALLRRTARHTLEDAIAEMMTSAEPDTPRRGPLVVIRGGAS